MKAICLRENQVAICIALSSHALMLVIYSPRNIVLMKLIKVVPETVSFPGKGLSLETEFKLQKHNAYHSELEEFILCLFMMVINPSLICHLR
jgi:hypothetical protein